jgi:beta-glucosidase
MKKNLLFLATFIISIVAFGQSNKDVKRQKFVNELLAKMTLEEKLGQLNLPASSDFVTGAVSSSDIAQKVKDGKVGGVFNIRSVTKIKELQEFAVNNTAPDPQTFVAELAVTTGLGVTTTCTGNDVVN